MAEDPIPVIAVDGAGGSGKGELSMRLVRWLGWHSLESGLLYRALALLSAQRGLETDAEAALASLAQDLELSFDARRQGGLCLQGRWIGSELRSEECARRASQIAVLPQVRKALLVRYRAFRQPPGLVAEGRDIGTIVFPDAELKIFLCASLAERAHRRHRQLNDMGMCANLAALAEEIARRDERDAQRSVAPLVPAPDAVVLDSSGESAEQVFNKVAVLVAERFAVSLPRPEKS